MRRLSVLLALLGVALFPPSANAASSGPMPRSDYPTPAKIQVVNPLDNANWDCAIAFDCSNASPLIHSTLSDELGRVTGWGVVTSSHHSNLQFITTSNIFETGVNAGGIQWNQAALDDETATMPTWQVAKAVTLTLPSLPDGARTLTWRIGPGKNGPGLLFVSAAWGETSEVELFAVYSKPYAKQAQRLLLKQLRDAITAVPAAIPTPEPSPTAGD